MRKPENFYARNTLNTTFARLRLTVAFGRLMQSFSADPANSHDTTRIHPALTSFADEVCGTLARLFAYVMTLALFAIGGMALWEQLPDAAAIDPSARGSSVKDAPFKGAPFKGVWSLADRSPRAFAVSQFDPHD